MRSVPTAGAIEAYEKEKNAGGVYVVAAIMVQSGTHLQDFFNSPGKGHVCARDRDHGRLDKVHLCAGKIGLDMRVFVKFVHPQLHQIMICFAHKVHAILYM